MRLTRRASPRTWARILEPAAATLNKSRSISSRGPAIHPEDPNLSNLKESLDSLMELAGAKCAALVDSTSGMVIGQSGSSANMDVAAAGNTEVVRAQLKLLESLGQTDSIDDILITLTTQYDILRLLGEHPSMFIYLTMDKSKSNLALARYKVAECEAQLVL